MGGDTLAACAPTQAGMWSRLWRSERWRVNVPSVPVFPHISEARCGHPILCATRPSILCKNIVHSPYRDFGKGRMASQRELSADRAQTAKEIVRLFAPERYCYL